jgi:competence CoiA-like predicted nuclease
MAYIDTAYYNEKQWCVYDLKDRHGNYIEEYRFAMRKESQNHEFFCMDCGETLILCAGNIKEPYFRHHDDADCVSTKLGIGKYDLAPRRLIYEIAKASFPANGFVLNRKLADGIRPLIFVDNPEGNEKLAVEYVSHVSRYDAWEKTFDYYNKNKIPVIYILNARRFADAFTHYGYMFYKNLHVWAVINSDIASLYLRHVYKDSIDKHLIQKEYRIDDIKFLMNGTFECDFETYCTNKIAKLKEEEAQRKLEQEETKARLIAKLELQAEKARRTRAVRPDWERDYSPVYEHDPGKSRKNNYDYELLLEQKKQQLINELSQKFANKNDRENMAASTKPVLYNEVRIVLCKRCGQVKPESEFYEYGGPGSVNLGTCYGCKKSDK